MGWTDLEERIAAVSKFDASVRLYARKAVSKPALIISLRKTITCDLKWKASDTFGLALGKDDNAGKVRIIRRKEKAIASPRQMKTGSLTFDFGHVASFGERGTLKAVAIAVVIDANTVQVTIPQFEYEDEIQEEDEEEQETTVPQHEPPAPARVPVAISEKRPAPITTEGVTVRFNANSESVSYRQKTMEITYRQAQVVAILAKAKPQPVDRKFIIDRAFNGKGRDAAGMALDQIYMDLSKALPGIGLQIKNIKGVGFALQESS